MPPLPPGQEQALKIRPPYMHPDIYGPDHPYRKVPLWFWKVVYSVIALCFVALGVLILLDLLDVREIRSGGSSAGP